MGFQSRFQGVIAENKAEKERMVMVANISYDMFNKFRTSDLKLLTQNCQQKKKMISPK